MMAYLVAQFVDIKIYHFWKKLTKGKHLWMRNNFSTMSSQFLDTFTVLFLLCSFKVIEWDLFGKLLINGYLFKVIVALFDTPFIIKLKVKTLQFHCSYFSFYKCFSFVE